MNRREFIQHTAIVTAATAASVSAVAEFTAEAKVNWPVGCFNRPWTKWSFDETLKQIKVAGYKTTGLLSRTKDDQFIAAEASQDYLDALKKKLAANGLTANMGALRSRHNIPIEDSVKEMRKQIDNARFLGLQFILSFGVDKPEEFAHYYKVMRESAVYAAEKKIKLVMKPHGGGSGSSDEILRAIKEVNHPNFKIWYDAGNIIHYTGKDPIEELKPIAQHVTGFCAKDCGAVKGEVMMQFGEGKVNFAGVFKALKAAGFKGPIMVEGVKVGATPEETSANAKANREFLEKVLAGI
ncbi:MAG: sugar phosphate isomerase/epimerase family protein [Blastocatellia bacterium]